MDQIEKVNIEVTRYRGKDGQPTCGIDFMGGKICRFIMVSSFGTKHHCFFDAAPESKTGFNTLKTYNGDGTGYYRPFRKCPLWSEDEIA